MESDPIKKLIFGTASLTSHRSLSSALAILNLAFDAGVTHFDTAAVYGKGYAEMILGNFIGNKRDKVMITTKFGLGSPPASSLSAFWALPLNYWAKKMRNDGLIISGGEQQLYVSRRISKGEVEAQLNGSLMRLKTSYIDYFFLHEGLPDFLTVEAWHFLLDQKEKGIIRKIGIAANRLNTAAIKPDQLNGWDVLQYDAEQGSNIEITGAKKIKHFHHSILKNKQVAASNEVVSNELAGYIIAQCVRNNPEGKIIFTTRNKTRLSDNLQSFQKFSQ